MKKSQFIVDQPGFSKNTVLLYSTFSTSLVELEKKVYEDIFINNKFEKNQKDIQALYDMGFLIPDDKDEAKFLEHLRIESLEANNNSPSYYIVCPTTGCNARCYYCFEKGIAQKRMDEGTAKAVAEC